MNTWLEDILLRLDAQSGCNGSPGACLELVNLYRDVHPLSALAYALKAVRLGMDMELSPLQTAVERLRSSEWMADPFGCYRLGAELASYPQNPSDTRRAIAFLKVAAGAEELSCSGPAALCLADLLSSLGENCADCYHYYAIAAAKGFGDLLAPRERARRNAEIA